MRTRSPWLIWAEIIVDVAEKVIAILKNKRGRR